MEKIRIHVLTNTATRKSRESDLRALLKRFNRYAELYFMSAIKNPESQSAAELMRDAATKELPDLWLQLDSTQAGLNDGQVADRLEKFGPNSVAQETKHSWLGRLWTAVRNPLVIFIDSAGHFVFCDGRFCRWHGDVVDGYPGVDAAVHPGKPAPITPPPNSRP